MKTTYLTITISVGAAPKKRSPWRAIARLSLLSLAAMLFARLVLMMIDLLQFQVGMVGAVTVPACAVVFIATGWKGREWWEEYTLSRKEDRECQARGRISGSAPTAGRTSIPARAATASRKGSAR